MMLGGDEMGHTQRGNNNAYCQDNELSWIDWGLTETNADLVRFFRLLIRFRREHRAFGHATYGEDCGPGCHVSFHGLKPDEPDWSWESRSLAALFTDDGTEGDAQPNGGGAVDPEDKSCSAGGNGSPAGKREPIDVYLIANAFWGALPFQLPAPLPGRPWRRRLDTSLPSPNDISEPGAEPTVADQGSYSAGPRSVAALIR
jgi:glycogen operon protein